MTNQTHPAAMRVPLPYFVDEFLLKTGVGRVAAVKTFKERTGPHADFYQPLRAAIVDLHEHDKTDGALDDFLASVSDERRRRSYPGEVAGYRRFLSSMNARTTWFQPPVAELPVGGVHLAVRPDVGLVINDTRHVILLHFGQRRPTARSLSFLLNGLNIALRPVEPKAIFGVLEVQNARLHTLKAVGNPRAYVLLRGEAACWETIHAAV